jgi:arylsulfatase A-like enzyme
MRSALLEWVASCAETRNNTLVVFVGDNGRTWRPPQRKGSVCEEGIHVPLIISGPPVSTPGATSDALVHTNDLFSLVLDVAGVPGSRRPRELDSVSPLPYLIDARAPSQREVVYSEAFVPNGPGPYRKRQRALLDERWKLIDHQTHYEFFDLVAGGGDVDNLLEGPLDEEQRSAFERLRERLEDGDF